MEAQPHTDAPGETVPESRAGGGDLADLLQEQRILLQGAQILTAFLVILPFQPGFGKIDLGETWVYLITFVCSLLSLIVFAAPAAQHRLERPLRDRARFKTSATRTLIAGLVPLSMALILVSKLIVGEVMHHWAGTIVAIGVAAILGELWWAFPLARKRTGREG